MEWCLQTRPVQYCQALLRRLQMQTARHLRRVANERALEDRDATLLRESSRSRQHRANAVRYLRLQPLQNLDQRLCIAQLRQAATQPGQFVVQPLRRRTQRAGAECKRGARRLRASDGPGLLQLLAGEQHETHAERRLSRACFVRFAICARDRRSQIRTRKSALDVFG